MIKIHPTANIDPSAEIGADCVIWQYSVVMGGCVLGATTKLGHNVFVETGVRVGSGCTIKDNVCLYIGVKIDDDVFVGPNAVFSNVKFPRAFLPGKRQFDETILRRGCTIGANATIVCGATIGQFALVGAGTVVTTDVPDYGLVVGNPAKRVGWVGRAGIPLNEELVCPETGERYFLSGDNLLQFISAP